MAVKCSLMFGDFFFLKESLIFIPVCSLLSRGTCLDSQDVKYEKVYRGKWGGDYMV